MSSTSDAFAELIDRYLAGKSTPEDQARIGQLLADPSYASDRLAGLAIEVKALLEDASATPVPYARIRDAVRARGVAVKPPFRERASSLHPLRWGIITAALVIMTLVMRRGVLTPSSAPVETYQTAAGQQAIVHLAHGVRARLAPATTLTVATNQADGRTVVTLAGQAQFVVARNPRMAFVVRTSHAITRVLGTTFLVRQYASDALAHVVVLEGRVWLQGTSGPTSSARGVVLGAGALGIVDDSGHVRSTPNIAVEEYTGWTNGHLVFQKTPVRDIVTELGRAYGADIRLTDAALAARVLTWTVPVQQKSLSSALDVLVTALDAHLTRSGTAILIIPGAASSPKPRGTPSPFSTEREYGK